jgi:hypothetical protein
MVACIALNLQDMQLTEADNPDVHKQETVLDKGSAVAPERTTSLMCSVA